MLRKAAWILSFFFILIAAWCFRGIIRIWILDFQLVIIGWTAGMFLLVFFLMFRKKTKYKLSIRCCRKRMELLGIVSPRDNSENIIFRHFKNINCFLETKLDQGLGRQLYSWWLDAGFGRAPILFVCVFPVLIGLVLFFGFLLTGSLLLASFLTFLCLLGLCAVIYFRANIQRHLFQDQFPDILDRLADSLQAGLSLPQAVEFVIPNIPDPGAWEMHKLAGQIQLGLSINQALKDLYRRRPTEDVRILVEGVILQQQVGGNTASMMRDIAAMIRTRVELKNEIRTQTAQGRLSAVVIALLLPVSLGLLTFFPGYTDVLFQTTIGNWILITAGLLEVIGGILIMRLIRIEV